jgi:AAA domain
VFLNHQLALEEYFIDLAKLTPESDAVILYDRGYLDCFAYMSPDCRKMYLDDTKVDLEHIRDNRYDMIVHLVTAANGAADKYTTSNNKARTEGIQQAINIDNKIKDTWNGHPNHLYSFLTQHHRQ